MIETWTVEEERKKIELHSFKNYKWCHISAIKIPKHRRTKGGIIKGNENELREDKMTMQEHQRV